mgnify:CR=1 FL=1
MPTTDTTLLLVFGFLLLAAYIGGGIVPRLGDFFDRSDFRSRFETKGRFSTYLATIPTWVITAANPALRGAAVALG